MAWVWSRWPQAASSRLIHPFKYPAHWGWHCVACIIKSPRELFKHSGVVYKHHTLLCFAFPANSPECLCKNSISLPGSIISHLSWVLSPLHSWVVTAGTCRKVPPSFTFTFLGCYSAVTAGSFNSSLYMSHCCWQDTGSAFSFQCLEKGKFSW